MTFDAQDHEAFFQNLTAEGFHLFSRKSAKKSGYYPEPVPTYPAPDLSEMKVGDRITVRAFFSIGKSAMPKIDSGHLDLEVEFMDPDEPETLFGVILTELPPTFALAKGTSVELSFDEVLSLDASS